MGASQYQAVVTAGPESLRGFGFVAANLPFGLRFDRAEP